MTNSKLESLITLIMHQLWLLLSIYVKLLHQKLVMNRQLVNLKTIIILFDCLSKNRFLHFSLTSHSSIISFSFVSKKSIEIFQRTLFTFNLLQRKKLWNICSFSHSLFNDSYYSSVPESFYSIQKSTKKLNLFWRS